MAVPTAVLRQREKLEKELGINRDGTPIEPVLDPQPPASASSEATPAPPVATPPPSAVDPAARIAELEQLLSVRDGHASSAMKEANDARSRADAMQAQVAALEQAVAELNARNETAEAKLAAKAADADMPSLDEVGDVSPKELEVFGEDSVKFIEKLSKKELLRYMRPALQKISSMEARLARLSELDKVPQLEKAVNKSQQDALRAKELEYFRREILAYFADFEAVRETQEWKNYIATSIPEYGITIRDQLNQYRMAHNYAGLRAIIGVFYDQQGKKPTLRDLAVPSKTMTEGTPVTKPRMKASEYQAKLKQFTGRVLSKADWNEYKNAFNTALSEERVDMDVRL